MGKLIISGSGYSILAAMALASASFTFGKTKIETFTFKDKDKSTKGEVTDADLSLLIDELYKDKLKPYVLRQLYVVDSEDKEGMAEINLINRGLRFAILDDNIDDVLAAINDDDLGAAFLAKIHKEVLWFVTLTDEGFEKFDPNTDWWEEESGVKMMELPKEDKIKTKEEVTPKEIVADALMETKEEVKPAIEQTQPEPKKPDPAGITESVVERKSQAKKP